LTVCLDIQPNLMTVRTVPTLDVMLGLDVTLFARPDLAEVGQYGKNLAIFFPIVDIGRIDNEENKH
jgi:hypothetical protein